MSGTATTEDFPAPAATGGPRRSVEGLGISWTCCTALGMALIVVGAMAVGASFVATLATVVAFGILLLTGAAVQIVGAFYTRQWSGFFLEALAGVLYLIIGLLMLNHPMQAAAGLTLMIAAFLMVGGMFRVVISLIERFDSWPWVLLHGIVSILLGVLIWRQWPLSGLWVIGLFVGIEMILAGWSWIMLGSRVRRYCQASC